jgi:hypothetical protein
MVIAAGLMVMLNVDEADCGDGCEESVTLMVADAVPAAVEAGVPLIEPLELLMASPPGRLAAVNV